VPGLSRPARHFDTTATCSIPRADNGVFDPVTPPSLRGAKYLGPYGHDGRFAAFARFRAQRLVNEFAGAEPSGEVLDALVTYIQDIAFLPNPQLAPGGRLSAQASDARAAARRCQHALPS